MKTTDNKQAKENANEEIYQELINMNIHDYIDLGEQYMRVTRVFNGWIYTEMNTENHEAICSTFVPDNMQEINANVRVES